MRDQQGLLQSSVSDQTERPKLTTEIAYQIEVISIDMGHLIKKRPVNACPMQTGCLNDFIWYRTTARWSAWSGDGGWERYTLYL